MSKHFSEGSEAGPLLVWPCVRLVQPLAFYLLCQGLDRLVQPCAAPAPRGARAADDPFDPRSVTPHSIEPCRSSSSLYADDDALTLKAQCQSPAATLALEPRM